MKLQQAKFARNPLLRGTVSGDFGSDAFFYDARFGARAGTGDGVGVVACFVLFVAECCDGLVDGGVFSAAGRGVLEVLVRGLGGGKGEEKRGEEGCESLHDC